MKKRSKIPTRLLDVHPFTQRLVADSKPILANSHELLQERVKKFGFKKRREEANLPQPFAYIHGNFHHVATLNRSVERLHQIRRFIRFFPGGRRFESEGITQDKWIQYHYANFLTTFVGTYDLALILTNWVFRLGIPNKKCAPDLIRENAWVKGTPVKPALEALEKVVQPHRGPRNSHIHRGEGPDLEILDELEVFSKLNLFSEEPVIPPKDLKRFYRLATLELDAPLEKDLARLEVATCKVFDVLLKYYLIQLSNLPAPNLEKLDAQRKEQLGI